MIALEVVTPQEGAVVIQEVEEVVVMQEVVMGALENTTLTEWVGEVKVQIEEEERQGDHHALPAIVMMMKEIEATTAKGEEALAGTNVKKNVMVDIKKTITVIDIRQTEARKEDQNADQELIGMKRNTKSQGKEDHLLDQEVVVPLEVVIMHKAAAVAAEATTVVEDLTLVVEDLI